MNGFLRVLARGNALVLGCGRVLGILAVAAMVAVTLAQVFCRYVLGHALAWPDEAARFFMLWMTALMAPLAFRHGGFVAIDLLPMGLPRKLAQILSLVLLIIATVVLVKAIQIGWADVTGIGGRFASASLYLPVWWESGEWYRVPRSWMMASLPVGMVLLLLVAVELILRTLAELCGVPVVPIAPLDLPEAE